MLEQIVGLEREVWQALVDGDAEADGRHLSEDFLGVYPTGFAGLADHVGQLADGPTVGWYELHDERLVELSEDAVLLAYRADYRRPGAAAGEPPESMYISSLWCRRDGRWVNVFSQDTPAGEPVP